MSPDDGPRTDGQREDVDVADVLSQLRHLEGEITDAEHRRELRQAKRMLRRLPESDRIQKYTTRDIGEALVGSIIFALPLLVEDGVFLIADHFLAFLVAGVPVFLLANVVFVIALTAGLLYAVDIREVKITNPLFGVVPRRLVGVLAISLLATAGLMVMWGRMFLDDPTPAAAFARITVIWAAAALGASLGDILPGESKGTDLTLENLDELVDVS